MKWSGLVRSRIRMIKLFGRTGMLTVELASNGCFAEDETERNMAREFIGWPLATRRTRRSTNRLADHLGARNPAPNISFVRVQLSLVLAPKRSLKSLGPLGSRISSTAGFINQRQGRLLYAQRVAEYILFLAEATGIASSETCDKTRKSFSLFASETS